MTNLVNQLEQIANMMSKANSNAKHYYDWLLHNGKAFKARPLTFDQEQELKQLFGRKIYRPKECFYSCQLIAIESDYQYWEGYGTTKTIELNLEHAWLVKNGEVYDPTWRDADEYFGVEIPKDYIRQNMAKTGTAECMLGKYFFETQKSKG